MFALFLSLDASDFFSFDNLSHVILSLLYDIRVQCLEPREKTHLVWDVSPHSCVKTFSCVVRLVNVAKDRKALWPYTFDPEAFDVQVVEGEHVLTVPPFQDLAFDGIFDAVKLRNNFVGR